MNRAGGATVALTARIHAKSVLVLCESYKMSDRVLLDSVCFNELCDPSAVWSGAGVRSAGRRPDKQETTGAGSTLPIDNMSVSQCCDCSCSSAGRSPRTPSFSSFSTCSGVSSSTTRGGSNVCVTHSCVGGIRVLNPCYDVTPSKFIDYIITEDGIFAATTVPALVREFGRSPAIAD